MMDGGPRNAAGRRGVVAVIPARAGSARLPGKNVRDFFGQPLVVWSVRAAMASRLLDRIVVSTDDPRVAAALARLPAHVIERPPHLATDRASTRDVLRHADAVLGGPASGPELMAVLQPTSPLREAGLIDSGIQRMRECPSADRLVEVTSGRLFTGRIADGWWQPDFPDGTRSQELPSLWYPTGRLYVVRCAALEADGRTERCLAHRGPRERWNNIDEEEDLLWARMIYQRFEPDYEHLRAPTPRP